MTPLRQRMIDAMQVRGFAQRTQEWVIGVRFQLFSPYNASDTQP